MNFDTHHFYISSWIMSQIINAHSTNIFLKKKIVQKRIHQKLPVKQTEQKKHTKMILLNSFKKWVLPKKSISPFPWRRNFERMEYYLETRTRDLSLIPMKEPIGNRSFIKSRWGRLKLHWQCFAFKQSSQISCRCKLRVEILAKYFTWYTKEKHLQ